MILKVNIIREVGDQEAILGLSLSYNSKPSVVVASRLAHKQGGHNKFLESVVVWLDVVAPRYFWQQYDTYRIGVTKQSESTMHTLMRSELTADMFQDGCNEYILDVLNEMRSAGDFDALKRHLPESFLQRRIVCTNYKVLQSIESQRRSHKLIEWQIFLNAILTGVEHPLWIRDCD